jgi:hypothetical protein
MTIPRQNVVFSSSAEICRSYEHIFLHILYMYLYETEKEYTYLVSAFPHGTAKFLASINVYILFPTSPPPPHATSFLAPSPPFLSVNNPVHLKGGWE